MSNWNVRYRKRLRLVPGVGINLNNRSASVSLGPRHAHLTVGTHGVRETIGLPGGSGLYATRYTPYPRTTGRASLNVVPTIAGGFLRGIAWVALAVLGLAAISALVGH